MYSAYGKLALGMLILCCVKKEDLRNKNKNLKPPKKSVNNTSVCKYWKILLYPTNTDTVTFYGGSTDIDTDAQYPKFNTDILVLPVFYSISI